MFQNLFFYLTLMIEKVKHFNIELVIRIQRKFHHENSQGFGVIDFVILLFSSNTEWILKVQRSCKGVWIHIQVLPSILFFFQTKLGGSRHWWSYGQIQHHQKVRTLWNWRIMSSINILLTYVYIWGGLVNFKREVTLSVCPPIQHKAR